MGARGDVENLVQVLQERFSHIAIRHQLSTNIWERGHPACPNARETRTFPVHAQLNQDCYIAPVDDYG
jgi:hypothetical protein